MPNANQGIRATARSHLQVNPVPRPKRKTGLNATQQQAQQELSRYGYSNLQDVTPMRGWVADATKNGERVRVMLSDNGLVATFPGR